MNENGAFNEIVDRYDGPKAIFIADRGYESINSFVKVGMENNNYLIRVKDIHSRTNVLRSFGLFQTHNLIYISILPWLQNKRMK